MKPLVIALFTWVVLVAAVVGCASAPTAAPPTVVVNATAATLARAANAAAPMPPTVAPTAYPYPPPNPTPQRTMAPRPTFPPPPTWTPTATRTPLPPHAPNDAAEENAIKAVIERSYIVRYGASFSGDIAPLDEAFVNHPSYPLTGERLRQYQGIRARVVGRVPTPAAPPGSLDYWRAYYTYELMDREQGALLSGTATALANPIVLAAHRVANATLMAQAAEGTPVAPLMYPTTVPVRSFDPNWKPNLRYLDINVQGDNAIVHLDDGIYDKRLVLVRTGKGWRIAEDVPLELHF